MDYVNVAKETERLVLEENLNYASALEKAKEKFGLKKEKMEEAADE